MTRLVSLLICLVMILFIPSLAVTANESINEKDSTYVWDRLQSQYEASDATLIRNFELSSAEEDSQRDSLLLYEYYRDMSSFNDLFSRIIPENYLVYWHDGRVDRISQLEDNGQIISAESSEINANGEVVFPYSKELLSLEAFEFYRHDNLSQHLGEDVTILQKFFVHEAKTTNVMILYITNRGNYVYFDNNQISPCLFTEAAFFDYLHLVYELNSILPNGSMDYTVCDLSAYTLNSSDFVPNANNIPWVPRNLVFWVCVAVIAVVAIIVIIAVIAYRKMVKAHNPYEERQGTEFDGEFVFYHNIDDRADSMDNQPARMN